MNWLVSGRIFNFIMAGVLALGVAACSNGAGNTASQATVAGSAGDGPIVGGTVTVTDANGNTVGTTTTDANAQYSINVPSTTPLPLTVTVTGGTDQVTGAAPDFPMKTAVTSTLTIGTTLTANANPLSTLAVDTAVALGGVTTANLATAVTNVRKTLGFGIDTTINPISTAVSAANVASVIKANEAAAELIRRAAKTTGKTVAQVITAIAEDVTDGALDGSVKAGVTATQTTANIAAQIQSKVAEVATEVITDKLKITDTAGATVVAAASSLAKLDSAATLSNGGTAPTTTVANVPLPAIFIQQAQTALQAASSLAGEGSGGAIATLATTIGALTAGAVPSTAELSTITTQITAATTNLGTATTNAGAGTNVAAANTVTKNGAANAGNPSLSGAVVDGRVSGATLTAYSDLAMTTQVGSGSTDSTGAFSITLSVATAPDPIYFKSEGGTDLDTGMPAPTMMFVGNTAGANALTKFNVTPLTKDVFDRVSKGVALATAQTNAQTAFTLTSNTGTNGLYEDPSAAANTSLKTAAFKKLTSGTLGATLAAGSYKLFAIIVSQSDIGNTAIANAAAIPTSNNFVSGSITVAADGSITGTAGANVVTGKVVGASVILNILNSATAPTSITRVVGNMGLNGSIAGNFTDITSLTTSPAMNKGMFVGSLVPASGINATGLATFISNFYSPGATTGKFNIVARDVFIDGVSTTVPRVHWGQSVVSNVAIGATSGTVTMGNMTMRDDAGSVAGTTNTLTYTSGTYVFSGGIPTNLLVFEYAGTGYTLYVCTSVGLRRGIYFVVPGAGPGAGKVGVAGESYMAKVDSVAPNPFVAGHTFDITVASINPGMPGQARSTVLSQGITPQVAGPMTIPATLTSGTIGNGYLDTSSGAPELMVFQGSMFVMKKDAANTFATNVFSTPAGADTHMRLVEFYDSGAMQGEEIDGGSVPGGTAPAGSTSTQMRDYPGNFIGFVHDQASATSPSFSGKLNFMARTIYGTSYAGFANAYTTGTLTITAPTTAAGSASLVATPAGGTSATSTLTVAVPATGAPGVYHMYGAISGGGYIDIVWPIGGTKALYMVSASATGTVSEVGEAYITQ